MPETGRSQPTNLETQKQTKWIEMHQSQVKMCFLRGPLDWLTEQKNPKFLWSLQNAQRDTTNLAISGDFFRYSKLMFFLCVIYIPLFFLAVLIWLGNSAWDFLGDKFWSSDFLGFCLKPKGFLGVYDFCPRLIIPVTWNPEYPLWASVKLKRTLNFSHFPSQVNITGWKKVFPFPFL